MTYKICAVLVMLLAFVMIPIAYADHPLTHGFDEHGCWKIYLEKDNKYITTCFWSYQPNEREREIIEAEKEAPAPECKEPNVLIDGVCTEPEPTVVEEPKRLDTSDPKQAMEFYIERLKAIDEATISKADQELLTMLESVHEICYFGVEEGRLIQKFAEFIIPTYEPDVETDLGNRWLLNQLFKKQQECSAWEVYKPKWLGQQYLDIEDEQRNRAEEIKAELLKKYPSDFTDPVTQRDLDDENDRSHDRICRSTLWGDQYKRDQGCFVNGELNGGTVPFSKQGEAVLAKWQTYLDTGAAELPPPKPEDPRVSPIDIIKNYMRAYNVTASDLED